MAGAIKAATSIHYKRKAQKETLIFISYPFEGLLYCCDTLRLPLVFPGQSIAENRWGNKSVYTQVTPVLRI